MSLADTLLGDSAIRSLLEAAGVWLWDCNLLDDTTDYQAGFWEHFGHDPTRMADTFDFISVMHTRDIQGVTKAWRAHLEGESDGYRAQWRLRTASGEWRWIQANGRVTERAADGTPTRMVGAYTDVTQAKLAQREAAGSNAEIDAIFRSARDGLALIAPDLTVLRVNDAAVQIVERFTGYRIAEGDNVGDIPTAEPVRPALRDIEAALSGNKTIPQREFSRADRSMWIDASYQPVYHPDGSILGVALTVRDTTERRRMEQSRSQTLRMESLGLMAGGIAHDFNNLLSAILGNIEAAEMSVTEQDARESLEDARGAARRASELVSQLLQFAGKHEPAMSPVDVSAIAREICRYARKIPGGPIPIVEELANDLPLLSADATQLRQLVLNLVVNALEATRDAGSRIVVGTRLVAQPEEIVPDTLLEPRAAPAYIALHVIDDGPGMDPYTREHLWDLFFTTKPTGHGLGLPSVLGTVRSHGGTLSVQSERGRGAAFSVFLPCGVRPL